MNFLHAGDRNEESSSAVAYCEGYFGVGVRLVLRLVWSRVMRTCECVLHVGQHGEVGLAFFIVPVKVNSEVA